MMFNRATKLSSSVPWLDIKLYKAVRLRGWAWDWVPILQLTAYSALLGLVLEFALSHTIFSRVSSVRIVLHWCLFAGLLQLVSRQHFEQWRRLHPHFYRWDTAPNFGTVATVYNRDLLPAQNWA